MGYHLGLGSFCLNDGSSYTYYHHFKNLAEPYVQSTADQIHQRIERVYNKYLVGDWDDALASLYEELLPELFYRLSYLMFHNITLAESWLADLSQAGAERHWIATICERTCLKVHRENSHPVNRAIVRTRKIMAAARKADQALYMGKTHTRKDSAELWQLCSLGICQDLIGVVVDMGQLYASMAHVHQTNLRPNAFVVQIYESIDRANFLPF